MGEPPPAASALALGLRAVLAAAPATAGHHAVGAVNKSPAFDGDPALQASRKPEADPGHRISRSRPDPASGPD